MTELSNWRAEGVLRKYHLKMGWSSSEIAEAADVSPALVASYLAKRGLLRKPELSDSSQESTHTCPECGEEFNNMDDWADHHQNQHFNY